MKFKNQKLLEKLTECIGHFNTFKVLRIEKHEIRHSNVLAWLMNPHASHGIGKMFLEKLIQIITHQNHSKIKAHNIDLSNFEILREWSHIDILAINNSEKLVILIENKIKAEESKGQLEKYLNTVRETYPDFSIIPVFLTLDRKPTKADLGYMLISHADILKILKELLLHHQKDISFREFNFLLDYKCILEDILGIRQQEMTEFYYNNKEIIDKELADEQRTQKLPEKYRPVIKAIKRRVSELISLKPAYERFMEDPEFVSQWITNGELHFLPKKIFDQLPQRDAGWRRTPWPLSFYFKRRQEKLKFHIEVGPLRSDRAHFINHLRSYGLVFGDSQVFSKMRRLPDAIINDWGDYDALLKEMKKLYDSARPKIEQLYQALINYPDIKML